jgi:DNA mismatch repair protein MutL
LFFNVPARRKYLRTERTERRHIDTLVTRYALAYPDLRLTLAHNDRTTFRSNGSGDLREVLVAVYGATNAAQMIQIGPAEATASSAVRVSGYVSAPSLHRSNRNEITLLINGRWVQDRRLTFAVVQAYHTLLMSGRYPMAVVKVDLPPQDVDVNVHPAKTEVRFRDGDAVFRSVQRAVRRALIDLAPVPQIGVTSPPTDTSAADQQTVQRGDAGWPGGWPTPEQVMRRAQLRAIGTRPPRRLDRPPDPQAVQFALDLTRPATDSVAPTSSTGDEREPSTRPEEGPGPAAPAPTRQFPLLRVVGQLGLTYIVAEGPNGMFLIDQHAAHERVLYEKFMAERARAQVATQALLEPVAVELTAEGASLVAENLEALLALGFDVQPFGSNTVLVRAVPAMLVDQDWQTVWADIVADLQVGDEPLASEVEAQIMSRVCKRAAIKAGQTLSRQEMEELIRQLEACAAPRTCPHGRPTMVHLSAEHLASEFGRLG